MKPLLVSKSLSSGLGVQGWGQLPRAQSPEPRAPLRGLTLVELLVTLSMVALVSGTVVATFAGGLRVWERVKSHSTQSQWLQLAYDQLRRDLHNVRRFAPIPYEGGYDTLAFPTVISTSTPEGVAVSEIGQAGYFLDEARHTLCRSQHPYRRLRSARLRDTCQPVMTGVTRLRFSYYALNPDNQTTEWLGSWSSAEPPLAVKIELRCREEAANSPVDHTLIVRLPLTMGPVKEPKTS